MSIPSPPRALPEGFSSWAEYQDHQIQEFQKPYKRPIRYEAQHWPQTSWHGPQWEIWARDDDDRLVGSETARYKWRAIQKIKRSIAEHEGRRTRRYRYKVGTIE